MMQDKAQKWINNVRSGHLHQRNVWFLLKVQFWPCVGCGLCSLTATLSELERALYREYYQILPLGKIVRTTPVESWTIDTGFYGIGLSHLGNETVIAVTNKLLMHYGCNIATGQLMHTSYLLFFAELGLSFTPLQESYSLYSFLVTHLWMKMQWEKVSKFDKKVVVTAAAQNFPRKGNQFIMQVLLQMEYNLDALLWLNRVRISLQLMFMLDILTASGNKINTKILSHHLPGEANLDMRWP